MKRLGKQNWFEAGLSRLADGRADDLKIESLCAELCVTKGSFYHHFRNQQEYVDGLLRHWLCCKLDALELMTRAAPSLNHKELLEQEFYARPNYDIEHAVRTQFAGAAFVHDMLARLDGRRTALLTRCCAELGYDAAEALARFEYAAWMGSRHIQNFTAATAAYRNLLAPVDSFAI